MSVIPSGNPALDKARSAYTDEQKKKKEEKSDALGRDTFLTMLVAQLQNQDPLNPMEGADFSAQLAQFSQLEQLMDLNESVSKMSDSSGTESGKDLMNYIGREVTGTVDKITVDEGVASSGTYTLNRNAEVKVVITNEDGETVRTLFHGQKSPGTEKFSWDAKGTDEELVEDGRYTYTVLANFGNGFVQVPSTVSGEVESITYKNEKPYLIVNGNMMDPSSVISIGKAPAESHQNIEAKNIMDYLGKTVTVAHPQIQAENGAVAGNQIGFHLDKPEQVTINIYNEEAKIVRQIVLPAEETTAGDNVLEWDGLATNKYHVPDGLYTYMVKSTDSFINTDATQQVSGIKSINGVQYLELENKQLAHLANVKGIQL